ncbi:septum site-determining protein [Streptomyces sp. L-9-10]|uniref:TadE/TadG family type IV pilus assembly protein n=1 Tax=unclassified Streptomyces TaxID=2593676 RepID=UPI00101D7ED5|nr:TadE/TadG family type IV pilus assembly protein [Streptomyces sp. L-9-10]RYJ24709.1 septum site-determining protein [Streptomyces sp. L-9-10]
MVKRTARGTRERGTREQGQIALEYVGVITLLLVLALAAIQLGLAGYAVTQASTAARTAARAATYNDVNLSPQAAGEAATSDWLTVNIPDPNISGDEVTVTAEVTIPAILPGMDLPKAKRSATMPLD